MAKEKPRPHFYDDDLPFWEGARAGELRLPRCRACAEVFWPAGPVCPQCLSDQIEWFPANGRGHIASWVVFHRAYFPGFEPPYNVAWVELDEGSRLPSNIVDVALEDLSIGMPVEVVFERVSDDLVLPRFRPANR